MWMGNIAIALIDRVVSVMAVRNDYREFVSASPGQAICITMAVTRVSRKLAI